MYYTSIKQINRENMFYIKTVVGFLSFIA